MRIVDLHEGLLYKATEDEVQAYGADARSTGPEAAEIGHPTMTPRPDRVLDDGRVSDAEWGPSIERDAGVKKPATKRVIVVCQAR